MSKKTNTLLFVLGATVFNVLVTLICFTTLFFILLQIFNTGIVSENVFGWAFLVIGIGSMAAAFFIYKIILKQILKRIDVEKYFDPIFQSRRTIKPRD